MDETKYRVCEYRNVVAAYRRFLGSAPARAAPADRLIRLLNIADTAVLAVKNRRRRPDVVAGAHWQSPRTGLFPIGR